MRIIKKIIKSILGRKGGQKYFELLYKLSLKGMNIGIDFDVAESGEQWLMEFVKNKTAKEDNVVIFDVGANIGDYSLQINDVFKDVQNVKIFAFEPVRKTFEILSKNTAETKSIEIFNFGFGDSDESKPFFQDKNDSTIGSLYDRKLDHFDIKLTEGEDVSIKKLDDFCVENKIDMIDFLKIDVEGYEMAVLKGANRMLNEGKIRFIQFEFGGCSIDARTYFQDFFYLFKDKYRLYRLVKNGIYPIDKYSETNEVFLTTNYFAEKIN